MDSDLDIIILTEDKRRLVADPSWIETAVGEPAPLVRSQEWGPLTERRVALTTGFEIEFGLCSPSWAGTDPVDPGTAHVVSGGCTSVVDPQGVFARLIEQVSAP
jgi:hypothetical protein